MEGGAGKGFAAWTAAAAASVVAMFDAVNTPVGKGRGLIVWKRRAW